MALRRAPLGARLLREWRAKSDLTQREVCAKLELDNGRYCAFERGRMRPGLPMAARIQEVTAGAVPAVSWVKDDKSARAREARAS